MSTQLLFYNEAKPVTVDRHRDLAIKAGMNYSFAKQVNSVPLTAVEFSQAAAEYPIVFAGTEEAIMPAVILGVQATENLYVDESGAWRGKYIPAFVRRYPFVFSSDEAGRNFVLHIDESFDGCNRKGSGERLFDNDGEQTQYLKSVLNFLQDYQGRFMRTKAYCDRLKSLELLQPMQAQFNLTSGETRSLSGFMTVDREKLKALSASDLETLFRNDELECTYLHLQSLRHFGDMIERFPTNGADADTDGPFEPAKMAPSGEALSGASNGKKPPVKKTAAKSSKAQEK